jgi:hypothetical protein
MILLVLFGDVGENIIDVKGNAVGAGTHYKNTAGKDSVRLGMPPLSIGGDAGLARYNIF